MSLSLWGSVSFPHQRLERTQWGLTDLAVFVEIIQFCFCDAKATVNSLLKKKKEQVRSCVHHDHGVLPEGREQLWSLVLFYQVGLGIKLRLLGLAACVFIH